MPVPEPFQFTSPGLKSRVCQLPSAGMMFLPVTEPLKVTCAEPASEGTGVKLSARTLVVDPLKK